MTEKKMSEEAEQKLTSIKSTKARAYILSTLVYSYACDITAKYEPLIEKSKRVLSEYKVPDQKEDVESVVAAIKKVVGKKYHLRHEVVCKIASGNELTFILAFNDDTVPVLSEASKKIESHIKDKKTDEARLATWNRKQLINIANGLDFEEFQI